MDKWQVYEWCKAHREMMLQMPIAGQIKYLNKNLSGVSKEVIAEGLAEFRSVPPHNWGPQIARAAK